MFEIVCSRRLLASGLLVAQFACGAAPQVVEMDLKRPIETADGYRQGGGDDPPWVLAAAGGGAVLLSIPFVLWSGSSLDSAVEAHNAALGSPVPQPEALGR